jgi:hypothetical protein
MKQWVRGPGGILIVMALAGAFSVFSESSSPAPAPTEIHGQHTGDHGIVALPWDAHTRVVDTRLALRVGSAELTTANVTYVGFEAYPQARAAFQHAIDIWMASIDSGVPLTVRAEFTTLAPSTLGSAGPGAYFRGLQPQTDTWYPVALANKLAGRDLDPDDFDVLARFNNQSPWYFGTDGLTPAGQYDFVTVVLHEMGHGLGFGGSMTVDASSGQGHWGLGTPYPFAYDRFAVNGSQQALLAFASPSLALAEQLQSGDLFWSGPAGVTANGSGRPRLYAPAVWAQGSSYSHLDESAFPAGSVNSLMTYALASAEAIHLPGPVALGMLQDMGWGPPPPPPCTFSLSDSRTTIATTGGAGSFTVITEDRCSWTTVSNSAFVSVTSPTGPRSGSGAVTFTVAPNPGVALRVGTITVGGQTFSITQTGSGPAISVSPSVLHFGAVNRGSRFDSVTSAQTVRLSQTGAGFVAWSASASAPWLRVTPQSGSAPATVSIEVVHHPSIPMSGLSEGTINFTFSGAGVGADPLTVTVAATPIGSSRVPFGAFETPADFADGVTGSIALTGWALDDIEVTAVTIYLAPDRSCGSPPYYFGLQYIGQAHLVEGARPDVAARFPNHPRSRRAGWGYMLLTNFLPNLGNGTYHLCAIANDREFGSNLVGVKTITVTNSQATKPFGAIDSPFQGEVLTGTGLVSSGWVLAPSPRRADPPGGGTVTVFVDSQPVGQPWGWRDRYDVSRLFPPGSYPGVNTAVASFGMNPHGLADGVHTIAWSVTDNEGNTDGIGSRYFTVQRESPGSVNLQPSIAAASPQGSTTVRGPIALRRGFDLSAPFRPARLTAGVVVVDAEELDRIELRLPGVVSGAMRAGSNLGDLPIGSRLDVQAGTFGWQPGVGFVGRYEFRFTRRDGTHQDVTITLHPRGSNRVGPQVMIDTPNFVESGFSRTLTIAGWALDLDDGIDTGVATVHVWAYPVDPLTGERLQPVFLGAAACGGLRPDVAATFGERYLRSGYSLTVDHLDPGTYDIAVFAWSTLRREFAPARVVRVRR